jgi:hypothetical protein
VQNLSWKYNIINRGAITLTEKRDNSIPKQALQYKLKGKRNVGCPKKIWMDQFHCDDQGIVTVLNASDLVMVMNVPATNMQLCSLDLTTLRRMVTENKEHTHTFIYIYNLLIHIFTHLLVCYFHCTSAYSSLHSSTC